MSTTSEPERILPYLDAGYWDGHMIGSGEQTQQLPPEIGQSPPKQIEGIMGKYVQAMAGGRLAGEFVPVHQFDPHLSNFGRLVMFVEEELSGPSVRPPEAARSAGGVERILIETPKLAFGMDADRPFFARGKYHTYIRQLMAGIVGPDKHHSRMLYGIPAHLINLYPDESVSISSAGWRNYQQPITVDQTMHLRGQSRERLSRILAILQRTN